MPRPLSATSKIGKAELGAAADRDVAGNAGLEIFQRVVDQIGKDLLQRQAVADDVRQRLDADLRLGLRGLMRHGRDDALDQLAVSIRSGGNSRRPSRVRLRIADDQAVHLGDRRFDEAERFRKIVRELLVRALKRGLGAVGGVCRRRAAPGRDAAEGARCA